mgnify:FL=1
MVDINFDTDYNKKISVVTCPSKSAAVLTVSASPGGFIFYSISADVGKVAEELAGRFTSIEKAHKAIESYYNRIKRTRTSLIREEDALKAQKRKVKENATELGTEDGKQIHQGPDN